MRVKDTACLFANRSSHHRLEVYFAVGAVAKGLIGRCATATERYRFFVEREIVAFCICQRNRAFDQVRTTVFNRHLNVSHRSFVSLGAVAMVYRY